MVKLFVYGSLAPGESNHFILKKMDGKWEKAHVFGKLYDEGWGARMGFPGIRFDEEKERVNGYLFHFDNRKMDWDKLDEFEGDAYQRMEVPVYPESGQSSVIAFVYALK